MDGKIQIGTASNEDLKQLLVVSKADYYDLQEGLDQTRAVISMVKNEMAKRAKAAEDLSNIKAKANDTKVETKPGDKKNVNSAKR